ncbi:hypothetical protein SLS54_000896 [Diplodia seriata]
MSKSTSSKHSRRDISDRSLKSLVPTKATLELLEHIVRVAWDGNLQERLDVRDGKSRPTLELLEHIVRVAWDGNLQEKVCEVALAIHKDLRSCFHNTTVTYETANRATHIVGEINVTVDCWLGQMRALQESISKINVRRDTPPNFMELPKEVHGKEIKKFRLMLSPPSSINNWLEPVCDAISERASTIEILALLKTFISHKHIAWIRGLSREPLEKRMDIIRKRVDGFLLAAPMRLFNEREYYEMRSRCYAPL